VRTALSVALGGKAEVEPLQRDHAIVNLLVHHGSHGPRLGLSQLHDDTADERPSGCAMRAAQTGMLGQPVKVILYALDELEIDRVLDRDDGSFKDRVSCGVHRRYIGLALTKGEGKKGGTYPATSKVDSYRRGQECQHYR